MESYHTEHGALVEVPLWDDHRRSKNWMAGLDVDPSSPGGLERTFAEKAKGEYFYILPAWLKPGVPLEFGADAYSCRGRKYPNRWYGYCVGITEEQVFLEPCGTGKEAVKKAAAWLKEQQAQEKRDQPWDGPIFEGKAQEFDLSHVPTEVLLAELKRRESSPE